MKIIGTTGNRNEFILTATSDELAKLVGYPYDTSSNYHRAEVGEEINIGLMWDQMARLSSKPDLLAMATKLRLYADAMTFTGEFAALVKVGPDPQ